MRIYVGRLGKILAYFIKGEETIIPVHWFDERPKIGIRLLFRSKNDVESKRFIKKVYTYTKWNFNFFIIWQTRKVESIYIFN